NCELPPLRTRILAQKFHSQGRALLVALRSGDCILANQHVGQTRIDVAVQDRLLVVTVLGETFDFLALNGHGALVLLHAVAVEDTNLDHRTVGAGRHAHGGVTDVRRLLTEDGAQELFFRRHRAFALRSDLADEDVTRLNFGADIDDAGFVQVAQGFFRDVRNVARDLFRSKLGVACHDLEFLDVDRGEDVIANDAFGQEDGVLVVVAVPRHERDEHVAAESQIAKIGRRTVSDDVTLLDPVTHADQRTLVDAGVLVRALELHQTIDVDARLRCINAFRGADNDTGRVHLVDDTGAACSNCCAGVTGHDRLHAGADERSLGANQRHRLTLHVRAHQSAVGVVVFEERDERGRNRNELLRRHVHQVHVFARRHHHFAAMTADDKLFLEAAILIEDRVCLSNVVLGLFHRGEIDDVLRDLVIHDLAVRRLDEAILVYAGKGRERVDQTDIRAFRRLNRADTSIVRRMHVADFEAGTLTRQTTRSKCRKTALVSDLRERVGLIHELRQLRGAEELANGGGSRLCIDQVLRHHRVDIDRGHTFLDRTLHAKQTNAVLVLHELAHRTHTAVAEIVDVVDLSLAVAQVKQRTDYGNHVFLAQNAHGVRAVEFQTHVHLHPPNGREIVALGIEEQRVEHRLRRIEGRRLTGAHDAIDVKQRILAALVLVGHKGVADVGADVNMVDIEEIDLVETRVEQNLERLLVNLVAG